MSSREADTGRPRRGRGPRRAAMAVAVVAGTLLMSGCTTADGRRMGLPVGITSDSSRVTHLWQGAWIAALAVGVVVWGLIVYAVIAYRRRGNEMPAQTRYNMPIEALYTIMPVVIVAVLFFYTARDETAILKKPAVVDAKVKVIGYRFAWTFAYSDPKNRFTPVYDVGTNSVLPVLWVPEGEAMEYELQSNDVIHAFWPVNFLFKMDVIPGRDNTFYKTATRLGDYRGRCSELCGINHANMLFTLRVVTPDQYMAHMADLKKLGQTGDAQGHLSKTYDPNANIAEARTSE